MYFATAAEMQHADEAGEHLLQRLVPDDAPDDDDQPGHDGRDDGPCEVLAGDDVGDDEHQRRRTGVDHAAPAADGPLEEERLLADVGRGLELGAAGVAALRGTRHPAVGFSSYRGL